MASRLNDFLPARRVTHALSHATLFRVKRVKMNRETRDWCTLPAFPLGGTVGLLWVFDSPLFKVQRAQMDTFNPRTSLLVREDFP